MSSNLLKGHYFGVGVQTTDARIIDTNALVSQKLNEIAEKMNQEARERDFSEGFTQGLDAEDVTSLLFQEEEGGEKEEEISAEEIIDRAKKKAETILADAKRQAEMVVSDSIAQGESAKQEILEKAREEGFQQGILRAREEVQQEKRIMNREIEEIRQEYAKKEEGMEEAMVDALTKIYNHIFHVELDEYKGILFYLISNTMHSVNGSKEIIVRVSPDDYSYVSGQKKKLLEQVPSISGTFEILEDFSLERNQCNIETESGIFDCGLDTQLIQLRKKLMLLSFNAEESD